MSTPDGARSTFLIENAAVISDPLGNEMLTGKSVAIDGAQIAAIDSVDSLRERYPQATRIDARGHLMLPGLIDGHTHLYAALTAGMPSSGEAPRNFPQVLRKVWWRWDKALRDQDNYQSGLIGAAASLHSGITTFFDHHASPHAVPDSLSHVSAGVERVGARACLAYEVSDRDGRRFALRRNCREQAVHRGKPETRRQPDPRPVRSPCRFQLLG